MADKRESNRLKDAYQRKVLDEATRRRRLKKAIEALEQDNYHDDPHADLDMHQNTLSYLESFEDTSEKKKRKRLKTEPFKQRLRKNFADLLEEEEQYFTKDKQNYLTAQIPPSKYPKRHLCAVCGQLANYTCVQCGARYCCVKCFGIHKETRCLKWTA